MRLISSLKLLKYSHPNHTGGVPKVQIITGRMTPGVKSKIKCMDYMQKSLSNCQMINNGSTKLAKHLAAAESMKMKRFIFLLDYFL
jgi:hypothetical protein